MININKCNGEFTGILEGSLSKEEKEKNFRNKLLARNDVFKCIECEIILSEKQLKTQGSSGAKKGVATLAFGIVGWAATSESSQNEEKRNNNYNFSNC